jgi:hypothetical protein
MRDRGGCAVLSASLDPLDDPHANPCNAASFMMPALAASMAAMTS